VPSASRGAASGSRILPLERMPPSTARTIVGGAGAFPFELTVPGGPVPCAGVTVVGVLPTRTGARILNAMMRAQLADVRGAASRSRRCGPPRRRSTAASATASRRSTR
jgi:hypothetical protein